MEQDIFSPNEGEVKKLPTFLNVLTILTFIGCALGLYQGFTGTFGKSQAEDMEKLKASMDQMPAFMQKVYSPGYFDLMESIQGNRMLLFPITLIGLGLCFWGAFQMRKFKKQGFTFYAIGQILPFAALLLFVGTKLFTPIMAIGLLFPLLMLLLYATQRKHLTE